MQDRAGALQIRDCTASIAGWPTGTRRCLLPFPMVRRMPRSRFKSPMPTLHNSLTRKPGGVEQFHHRAIPHTSRAGHIGRFDDFLYLFQIQILRNILPLLGGMQVLGRVERNRAFPEQKAIKIAQGRQMTSHRPAAQSRLIEMVDVPADVLGSRQLFTFTDKLFKISQIHGIRVNRIGGQPLFQAAEVQKRSNLVAQVYRTFRKRSRHRANDTISREMFETLL